LIEIQKHFLDPQEQEIWLRHQIAAINSEKGSIRHKEQKFKKLHSSVSTPLAKSHVGYYLNKLKKQRHTLYGRILVLPFILAYLVYILHVTYSYISSEQNIYENSVFLTQSLQTAIVLIAPLVLLAYFFVYFAFIEIKKTLLKLFPEYSLKYKCMLFILVILFAVPTIMGIQQILGKHISTEQNISEAYIGTWNDTTSQRCWLTIENTYDTYYELNIYWSSSAAENTEWNFHGTLDETTGIITYSGDQIHSVYHEDGTIFKEFIYTDGSGQFYLDENQNLYWDDWKEQAGSDCLFQKTPSE